MIGPALALLLLASAGLAPAAGPAQTPPSRPAHKAASQEPLDFRGPGRDEPEPDVEEVVLGWFGPGDPAHPELGEYWRGASLALEQENAAGGYRGRPFRLEAAWSENPWRAGILGVTRLVYDRGAWAVIGGVDGATTHLAVQLALKSHFLLMSPGSSDVTADDANVPWLFSLPPGDDRVADSLARALAGSPGPFAVVAAADHDAHAALVALRRALASRRLSAARVVELAGDAGERDEALRDLLGSGARAIVVLGGGQASAAVVRVAREAGFTGPVFGGLATARSSFARSAGDAAAGVRAPAWLDTRQPRWAAFAAAYGARWHEAPDWAAAAGYDALRLVAAAIRRAGLNRARIRDAVRALAPYEGATGVVRWNARNRNEPALRLDAR